MIARPLRRKKSWGRRVREVDVRGSSQLLILCCVAEVVHVLARYLD